MPTTNHVLSGVVFKEFYRRQLSEILAFTLLLLTIYYVIITFLSIGLWKSGKESFSKFLIISVARFYANQSSCWSREELENLFSLFYNSNFSTVISFDLYPRASTNLPLTYLFASSEKKHKFTALFRLVARMLFKRFFFCPNNLCLGWLFSRFRFALLQVNSIF